MKINIIGAGLGGLTFGFPIGLACCAAGVFLGNTLVYVLYKVFGDGIRQYFVKNLHLDLEKAARSKKTNRSSCAPRSNSTI